MASKMGSKLEAFRQKVERMVVTTLRKASTEYQQQMIGRLSGPTGPDTLSRRTGQLARSVKGVVESTGSTVKVTLSIGAQAPYAKIHETGGTITPKRSRYLAIPLAAAKTAAGVTRLASPRMDPTLRLIRSKAGNLLLVRPKKRGGFTPMWVLKSSVTIPARLGFAKTARAVLVKARADIAAGFKALVGG